MSASLELRTEVLAQVPADPLAIRELVDIVTKTLPDLGLGRMSERCARSSRSRSLRSSKSTLSACRSSRISGGGDSNTLVSGLTKYVQASSQPASGIVSFTLAMDPLWPETAVNRARELCDRAGFEHRVLHASDMADLLGMNTSPAKLWEAFRRDYGPDSVHFFGTFFVNLVGRRLCREASAHHLCVGYNREDIMAELLFCLMNGGDRCPTRRAGWARSTACSRCGRFPRACSTLAIRTTAPATTVNESIRQRPNARRSTS